jgi:DNA-binding NarL/FixJ family response regulator
MNLKGQAAIQVRPPGGLNMSTSATVAVPATGSEIRAFRRPEPPKETPPVPATAPRIFAIDRRPLLRSGLAGLARRALDCNAHALRDLDQATGALALVKSPPHAVLLGLGPEDDAEQLVRGARRLGAPVVCVLEADEGRRVRAALAAGADGYLLFETANALSLRATIGAVRDGERVIPAELEAYSDRLDGKRAITVRCLEVLRSLAEGLHDDEIADQLGISTSSVRKHIASAQERLQARTRTQVMAIVAGDGLV